MDGQLRKSLKKAPSGSKLFLVFMAGFMAVWAYLAYGQLKQGEIDTFRSSMIYLAIVAILFIAMLANSIAESRRVRKNGQESMAYLDENGLWEKAETEYCAPESTRCRVRRDSIFDLPARRKNVLSESFVFAMEENIIIPYSEIGWAGVERKQLRRKRRIRKRWMDTVYIRLRDGRKVKIHTVKDKKYTDEQKQTVEAIFEHIRQGKPECDIDCSIISEYISVS